jgi:hypothetical protein
LRAELYYLCSTNKANNNQKLSIMKTTIEEVQETGKFQLGYAKADNPATYKQIKFVRSLAKSCAPSTSQMMKRLEIDEASDLIDLGKQGVEFEITD